jgi:hypothetical protein
MQSDEPDIYRMAERLIERHGEHAPIEAANKSAECLARRDEAASSVWKRVCFAALELLRRMPAQAVH